MKSLVIAEKPSVARDIARVLKCGRQINGAIEGGADTFFGKGKASAADRIFARLTSIVGVIFVIAAIVLNVVH